MTLVTAAAWALAADVGRNMTPAHELQQTICTSLQCTGYRLTGQTDGGTDRHPTVTQMLLHTM